MSHKIPKEPIRTATNNGYMGQPTTFRVYVESNGLALGHTVASEFWQVIHLNTGLPIGCPAKINGKAKTKVLAFFSYLADAPFNWGDWLGKDEKPIWAEQSKKYCDSYNPIKDKTNEA
jgi:hypothetical protein